MTGKREPEAELLSLVYQQAVQSLEAQRGTVDHLRSRAGILLTGPSIASSFLGGIALSESHFGLWSVLAIVAFVCIGLLAFAILWPYNWAFGFDPHDLLRNYIDSDPPASATEAKRDLTIYAGDYLIENEGKLATLWWLYRIAIALLVLLIAFWLIDIAVAT